MAERLAGTTPGSTRQTSESRRESHRIPASSTSTRRCARRAESGSCRVLLYFSFSQHSLTRPGEDAKRSSMPIVLDAQRIARSLARIAHEILERNRGLEELALVGIRTRGVPLARRLARTIHDIQ